MQFRMIVQPYFLEETSLGKDEVPVLD